MLCCIVLQLLLGVFFTVDWKYPSYIEIALLKQLIAGNLVLRYRLHLSFMEIPFLRTKKIYYISYLLHIIIISYKWWGSRHQGNTIPLLHRGALDKHPIVQKLDILPAGRRQQRDTRDLPGLPLGQLLLGPLVPDDLQRRVLHLNAVRLIRKTSGLVQKSMKKKNRLRL